MYVFTANAVLNDYLRVSGPFSRFIGKLWVLGFIWMGVPLPPCHVSLLFFSYVINLIVCLITSYKPAEKVGKYLK